MLPQATLTMTMFKRWTVPKKNGGIGQCETCPNRANKMNASPMTVLKVRCSQSEIGVFVRLQYHGPLVNQPAARNMVPSIANQMRNKSGKSRYGIISGTLEL
jgi:hypothetical protein